MMTETNKTPTTPYAGNNNTKSVSEWYSALNGNTDITTPNILSKPNKRTYPYNDYKFDNMDLYLKTLKNQFMKNPNINIMDLLDKNSLDQITA
jgi:hypothetical protein